MEDANRTKKEIRVKKNTVKNDIKLEEKIEEKVEEKVEEKIEVVESIDDKEKARKKEFFSWIRVIIIAILIAVFINSFIIINADVTSGSMETTLMTGGRAFGFRLAYVLSEPERFDIIVFKYPDDESKKYVKRIIGLPGETVEVIDGKVYIDGNGNPLEDDFVNGIPTGDFGPYVVPENSYFVMGDNRENSIDSRYWTNKYVTEDEILGKVVMSYWPSVKFFN